MPSQELTEYITRVTRARDDYIKAGDWTDLDEQDFRRKVEDAKRRDFQEASEAYRQENLDLGARPGLGKAAFDEIIRGFTPGEYTREGELVQAYDPEKTNFASQLASSFATGATQSVPGGLKFLGETKARLVDQLADEDYDWRTTPKETLLYQLGDFLGRKSATYMPQREEAPFREMVSQGMGTSLAALAQRMGLLAAGATSGWAAGIPLALMGGAAASDVIEEGRAEGLASDPYLASLLVGGAEAGSEYLGQIIPMALIGRTGLGRHSRALRKWMLSRFKTPKERAVGMALMGLTEAPTEELEELGAGAVSDVVREDMLGLPERQDYHPGVGFTAGLFMGGPMGAYGGYQKYTHKEARREAVEHEKVRQAKIAEKLAEYERSAWGEESDDLRDAAQASILNQMLANNSVLREQAATAAGATGGIADLDATFSEDQVRADAERTYQVLTYYVANFKEKVKESVATTLETAKDPDSGAMHERYNELLEAGLTEEDIAEITALDMYRTAAKHHRRQLSQVEEKAGTTSERYVENKAFTEFLEAKVSELESREEAAGSAVGKMREGLKGTHEAVKNILLKGTAEAPMHDVRDAAGTVTEKGILTQLAEELAKDPVYQGKDITPESIVEAITDPGGASEATKALLNRPVKLGKSRLEKLQRRSIDLGLEPKDEYTVDDLVTYTLARHEKQSRKWSAVHPEQHQWGSASWERAKGEDRVSAWVKAQRNAVDELRGHVREGNVDGMLNWLEDFFDTMATQDVPAQRIASFVAKGGSVEELTDKVLSGRAQEAMERILSMPMKGDIKSIMEETDAERAARVEKGELTIGEYIDQWFAKEEGEKGTLKKSSKLQKGLKEIRQRHEESLKAEKARREADAAVAKRRRNIANKYAATPSLADKSELVSALMDAYGEKVMPLLEKHVADVRKAEAKLARDIGTHAGARPTGLGKTVASLLEANVTEGRVKDLDAKIQKTMDDLNDLAQQAPGVNVESLAESDPARVALERVGLTEPFDIVATRSGREDVRDRVLVKAIRDRKTKDTRTVEPGELLKAELVKAWTRVSSELDKRAEADRAKAAVKEANEQFAAVRAAFPSGYFNNKRQAKPKDAASVVSAEEAIEALSTKVDQATSRLDLAVKAGARTRSQADKDIAPAKKGLAKAKKLLERLRKAWKDEESLQAERKKRDAAKEVLVEKAKSIEEQVKELAKETVTKGITSGASVTSVLDNFAKIEELAAEHAKILESLKTEHKARRNDLRKTLGALRNDLAKQRDALIKKKLEKILKQVSDNPGVPVNVLNLRRMRNLVLHAEGEGRTLAEIVAVAPVAVKVQLPDDLAQALKTLSSQKFQRQFASPKAIFQALDEIDRKRGSEKEGTRAILGSLKSIKEQAVIERKAEVETRKQLRATARAAQNEIWAAWEALLEARRSDRPSVLKNSYEVASKALQDSLGEADGAFLAAAKAGDAATKIEFLDARTYKMTKEEAKKQNLLKETSLISAHKLVHQELQKLDKRIKRLTGEQPSTGAEASTVSRPKSSEVEDATVDRVNQLLAPRWRFKFGLVQPHQHGETNEQAGLPDVVNWHTSPLPLNKRGIWHLKDDQPRDGTVGDVLGRLRDAFAIFTNGVIHERRKVRIPSASVAWLHQVFESFDRNLTSHRLVNTHKGGDRIGRDDQITVELTDQNGKKFSFMFTDPALILADKRDLTDFDKYLKVWGTIVNKDLFDQSQVDLIKSAYELWVYDKLAAAALNHYGSMKMRATDAVDTLSNVRFSRVTSAVLGPDAGRWFPGASGRSVAAVYGRLQQSYYSHFEHLRRFTFSADLDQRQAEERVANAQRRYRAAEAEADEQLIESARRDLAREEDVRDASFLHKVLLEAQDDTSRLTPIRLRPYGPGTYEDMVVLGAMLRTVSESPSSELNSAAIAQAVMEADLGNRNKGEVLYFPGKLEAFTHKLHAGVKQFQKASGLQAVQLDEARHAKAEDIAEQERIREESRQAQIADLGVPGTRALETYDDSVTAGVQNSSEMRGFLRAANQLFSELRDQEDQEVQQKIQERLASPLGQEYLFLREVLRNKMDGDAALLVSAFLYPNRLLPDPIRMHFAVFADRTGNTLMFDAWKERGETQEVYEKQVSLFHAMLMIRSEFLARLPNFLSEVSDNVNDAPSKLQLIDGSETSTLNSINWTSADSVIKFAFDLALSGEKTMAVGPAFTGDAATLLKTAETPHDAFKNFIWGHVVSSAAAPGQLLTPASPNKVHVDSQYGNFLAWTRSVATEFNEFGLTEETFTSLSEKLNVGVNAFLRSVEGAGTPSLKPGFTKETRNEIIKAAKHYKVKLPPELLSKKRASLEAQAAKGDKDAYDSLVTAANNLRLSVLSVEDAQGLSPAAKLLPESMRKKDGRNLFLRKYTPDPHFPSAQNQDGTPDFTKRHVDGKPAQWSFRDIEGIGEDLTRVTVKSTGAAKAPFLEFSMTLTIARGRDAWNARLKQVRSDAVVAQRGKRAKVNTDFETWSEVFRVRVPRGATNEEIARALSATLVKNSGVIVGVSGMPGLLGMQGENVRFAADSKRLVEKYLDAATKNRRLQNELHSQKKDDFQYVVPYMTFQEWTDSSARYLVLDGDKRDVAESLLGAMVAHGEFEPGRGKVRGGSFSYVPAPKDWQENKTRKLLSYVAPSDHGKKAGPSRPLAAIFLDKTTTKGRTTVVLRVALSRWYLEQNIAARRVAHNIGDGRMKKAAENSMLALKGALFGAHGFFGEGNAASKNLVLEAMKEFSPGLEENAVDAYEVQFISPSEVGAPTDRVEILEELGFVRSGERWVVNPQIAAQLGKHKDISLAAQAPTDTTHITTPRAAEQWGRILQWDMLGTSQIFAATSKKLGDGINVDLRGARRGSVALRLVADEGISRPAMGAEATVAAFGTTEDMLQRHDELVRAASAEVIPGVLELPGGVSVETNASLQVALAQHMAAGNLTEAEAEAVLDEADNDVTVRRLRLGSGTTSMEVALLSSRGALNLATSDAKELNEKQMAQVLAKFFSRPANQISKRFARHLVKTGALSSLKGISATSRPLALGVRKVAISPKKKATLWFYVVQERAAYKGGDNRLTVHAVVDETGVKDARKRQMPMEVAQAISELGVRVGVLSTLASEIDVRGPGFGPTTVSDWSAIHVESPGPSILGEWRAVGERADGEVGEIGKGGSFQLVVKSDVSVAVRGREEFGIAIPELQAVQVIKGLDSSKELLSQGDAPNTLRLRPRTLMRSDPKNVPPGAIESLTFGAKGVAEDATEAERLSALLDEFLNVEDSKSDLGRLEASTVAVEKKTKLKEREEPAVEEEVEAEPPPAEVEQIYEFDSELTELRQKIADLINTSVTRWSGAGRQPELSKEQYRALYSGRVEAAVMAEVIGYARLSFAYDRTDDHGMVHFDTKGLASRLVNEISREGRRINKVLARKLVDEQIQGVMLELEEEGIARRVEKGATWSGYYIDPSHLMKRSDTLGVLIAQYDVLNDVLLWTHDDTLGLRASLVPPGLQIGRLLTEEQARDLLREQSESLSDLRRKLEGDTKARVTSSQLAAEAGSFVELMLGKDFLGPAVTAMAENDTHVVMTAAELFGTLKQFKDANLRTTPKLKRRLYRHLKALGVDVNNNAHLESLLTNSWKILEGQHSAFSLTTPNKDGSMSTLYVVSDKLADPKTPHEKALLAEVMAHEVGHYVESRFIFTASPEVRAGLIRDWMKWRRAQSRKRKSAFRAVMSRSGPATAFHMMMSLKDISLNTDEQQFGEALEALDEKLGTDMTLSYALDFGEWFADQMTRYVISGKNPGLDSAVKKWWGELKSILSHFYKILSEKFTGLSDNSVVAPSFQQFMASLEKGKSSTGWAYRNVSDPVVRWSLVGTVTGSALLDSPTDVSDFMASIPKLSQLSRKSVEESERIAELREQQAKIKRSIRSTFREINEDVRSLEELLDVDLPTTEDGVRLAADGVPATPAAIQTMRYFATPFTNWVRHLPGEAGKRLAAWAHADAVARERYRGRWAADRRKLMRRASLDKPYATDARWFYEKRGLSRSRDTGFITKWIGALASGQDLVAAQKVLLANADTLTDMEKKDLAAITEALKDIGFNPAELKFRKVTKELTLISGRKVIAAAQVWQAENPYDPHSKNELERRKYWAVEAANTWHERDAEVKLEHENEAPGVSIKRLKNEAHWAERRTPEALAAAIDRGDMTEGDRIVIIKDFAEINTLGNQSFTKRRKNMVHFHEIAWNWGGGEEYMRNAARDIMRYSHFGTKSVDQKTGDRRVAVKPDQVIGDLIKSSKWKPGEKEKVVRYVNIVNGTLPADLATVTLKKAVRAFLALQYGFKLSGPMQSLLNLFQNLTIGAILNPGRMLKTMAALGVWWVMTRGGKRPMRYGGEFFKKFDELITMAEEAGAIPSVLEAESGKAGIQLHALSVGEYKARQISRILMTLFRNTEIANNFIAAVAAHDFMEKSLTNLMEANQYEDTVTVKLVSERLARMFDFKHANIREAIKRGQWTDQDLFLGMRMAAERIHFRSGVNTLPAILQSESWIMMVLRQFKTFPYMMSYSVGTQVIAPALPLRINWTTRSVDFRRPDLLPLLQVSLSSTVAAMVYDLLRSGFGDDDEREEAAYTKGSQFSKTLMTTMEYANLVGSLGAAGEPGRFITPSGIFGPTGGSLVNAYQFAANVYSHTSQGESPLWEVAVAEGGEVLAKEVVLVKQLAKTEKMREFMTLGTLDDQDLWGHYPAMYRYASTAKTNVQGLTEDIDKIEGQARQHLNSFDAWRERRGGILEKTLIRPIKQGARGITEKSPYGHEYRAIFGAIQRGDYTDARSRSFELYQTILKHKFEQRKMPSHREIVAQIRSGVWAQTPWAKVRTPENRIQFYAFVNTNRSVKNPLKTDQATTHQLLTAFEQIYGYRNAQIELATNF